MVAEAPGLTRLGVVEASEEKGFLKNAGREASTRQELSFEVEQIDSAGLNGPRTRPLQMPDEPKDGGKCRKEAVMGEQQERCSSAERSHRFGFQ
ncbi:hypothetical protein HYQ46_004628 [Verticillium longisporum]|nr:hypothetical protein HYQ46_004628 [Verticillium longisporum]